MGERWFPREHWKIARIRLELRSERHVSGETLLEGTTEGERLKLAGAGAWTAKNARSLEALIDGETRRQGTLKGVDIDMAKVERLDTFGAWLLERLVRDFGATRAGASTPRSATRFTAAFTGAPLLGGV